MCRYIGRDAKRKTPTKDNVELTGSVASDVSKNIYDLAGNCDEWTMEAYYVSERVKRGGNYHSGNLVSSRGYATPNSDDAEHGDTSFRPTLYIK